MAVRVKHMIEEWRERLPCIMDLGNPALRPRHWEKIFKKPLRSLGMKHLKWFKIDIKAFCIYTVAI